RETVLEPVDLPQLRDAHRAARAFEQLLAVGGALPQACELAETELEDAGHAGGAALRLDGAIQGCEVIARPESSLEPIGIAPCAADDAPLAKDDRPGAERREQQQRNDDLHRHARLHDESQDRERLTHWQSPRWPRLRAGTAAGG